MIKYLLYLILVLCVIKIYNLNNFNNVLCASISIILGVLIINWLFPDKNMNIENFKYLKSPNSGYDTSKQCEDNCKIKDLNCNQNVNVANPNKYYCSISKETNQLNSDEIIYLINNSIYDLHIQELTNTQLQSIPINLLPKLTPTHLSKLSSTQITDGLKTNIKYLNFNQLSLLEFSNLITIINIITISLLTPPPLPTLSPNIQSKQDGLTERIKSLTPEEIKLLTGEQITVLTPTQISELTVSQISAIIEEQIYILSPQQVVMMTLDQIKALSIDQIKYFNFNQLSNISNDKLKIIIDKIFEPEDNSIFKFFTKIRTYQSDIIKDFLNNIYLKRQQSFN